MDMMGLIALRFEEKEAHRVVVGVLGVFVRLLPRWVGFVDVQPLFLSPKPKIQFRFSFDSSTNALMVASGVLSPIRCPK